MIFAAGFGTRMGTLTKDRPKPLIEVAGRPLIDHTLKLAQDAACDPIVVNLHYKRQMLHRHLTRHPVRTIDEIPDILETGGGLRNALPVLGKQPVFTLNTDAIWAGPNPLELLRAAWDPEEMDALLVCITPARAFGHQGAGDFAADARGCLRRGTELIYGGAQILKTDRLSKIDERSFSLNQIWDLMLSERRVFGLTYPGKWCDVGHPQSIKIAERMLKNHHV